DVFISCQVAKPSMTGTTGAIFKVPKEVFDGIDEAHDEGFAVAVAYPNPGKDVLNIRTGLKDARVEVYDMSGRLMHRQDITENVTGIDTGGWAAGSYVWIVYTGVSTGSTTLVETGKWIKE
ncbi:MAG: T9SS type A sorting domain-containing protein, partial [Bacteroidales bacterium]|nr:T9SS type A sorting domain-containing protein [Bacteroidales bacterium]